jgi:YVTN family beta-propeller protein
VAEDTSRSGAPGPPPATELRTFLIADIRGYTRFTREHGDEAASGLATDFAAAVRRTIGEFQGHLVELRGDEALCAFGSARQALRAAMALQQSLRIATPERAAFPLGVGVGLDAGEPVATEGGYRGGALNVASRLCSIAAPGQVLASETVTTLAQRIPELRYLPPRTLRLKGIDEAVRVVGVLPADPLPPLPLPPETSSRLGRVRIGVLVAGALAAVLIGVVAWESARGSSPRPAGVPVRANTVAVIDPATSTVVRDIPVGRGPSAIAVRFGQAWVADSVYPAVDRIDLKTGRVATPPTILPGAPTAITTGLGYVWAFDTTSGRVFQINRTGGRENTYRVPACVPAKRGYPEYNCRLSGIAAGFGRVWVTDGGDGLYSLRPSTDTKFRRVPGSFPAYAVIVGHGRVYTADTSSIASIQPIGPLLGEHIPGTAVSEDVALGPLGMATDRDWVWAVSPSGRVVKLDPTTLNRALAPHRTAPGTIAVTPGGGALWVINISAGSVLRMDPASLGVQQTIHLGSVAPSDAAFANGRLWVSVEDPQDTPIRIYL